MENINEVDISFIIVNYKTEDFLTGCVSSIKKKSVGLKSEIIIFNNDKSTIKSGLLDEKVIVIENSQNIGFGAACNAASRLCKGRLIFFLNPDARIKTDNLKDIVSLLESDDSIAIAAPRVVDQEGETEKWSFGNHITPLGLIKNKFYKSSGSSCSDIKTCFSDWISGAALLIKSRAFYEVGGFDDEFFMYFEDVDLCKRVRDSGFKIARYPFFLVEHTGGGSFDGKLHQKSLYYASQDKYFLKHFGQTWSIVIKILRFFFK